jgi:hypothetical protein
MAKIERDTLLQRHIDDVVALILDGLRDTANDAKPSEAPPARHYLLGMQSDYRPQTLLRMAPVQGHAVFDFAEWQRRSLVADGSRGLCGAPLVLANLSLPRHSPALIPLFLEGPNRRFRRPALAAVRRGKVCVTPCRYAPSKWIFVAPTRRSLTRGWIRLKSHEPIRRWTLP